jgi:hypothetical protein
MCSEKRETSLVTPLQEDQSRSPKLPFDVLSCQRGVVIIQHLQIFAGRSAIVSNGAHSGLRMDPKLSNQPVILMFQLPQFLDQFSAN